MIKKLLKRLMWFFGFMICMFGPFFVGNCLSLMDSWYGLPTVLVLILWWVIGCAVTSYELIKTFGIDLREMG